MSISYGFYNSYNHDRLYDAVQFGSLFDGLIADGVYAAIGDKFKVSSVPGSLSIKIGTGRAWLFHTWTLVDIPYDIPIEQAELLQNRTDTVVIEVNYETRVNSIFVKKGSSSLVWTDTIHQYKLAEVLVKPNDLYIPESQITSFVGTSNLPFVAGLIDNISIDSLLTQWRYELDLKKSDYEDQFNQWFNELRSIVIDGSVAANLAAKVLELRDRWRTLHRNHITVEPLVDDEKNIVLDAYGMPVEGRTRFSTYFESVNTDLESTPTNVVPPVSYRESIVENAVNNFVISGMTETNPGSNVFGFSLIFPHTEFGINATNVTPIPIRTENRTGGTEYSADLTVPFYHTMSTNVKLKLKNITAVLYDITDPENEKVLATVSNVVDYRAQESKKVLLGPTQLYYKNETNKAATARFRINVEYGA